MELKEIFSYEFILRALIAGSFIALICSLLGVQLVLRRLSLIGDGLSHVTFGGVALGIVLGVYPIYIAIPFVIVCSLGILQLIDRAKIYGDAAIGIVSSIGIAAGILLASLAGGFNIDLFSFLFGSILAISRAEVIISIALSAVVFGVILVYYYEIFSITFDEEFARASGINTKRINTIIVILTAVTVVLAMKVVGIMLTSALLILPAVSAFQIAKSFKSSLVIASVLAVLSVVSGIFLSFIFNLPTGACIVIINFLCLCGIFLYKKMRK